MQPNTVCIPLSDYLKFLDTKNTHLGLVRNIGDEIFYLKNKLDAKTLDNDILNNKLNSILNNIDSFISKNK